MPLERTDRFTGEFGESVMVRRAAHPRLRAYVHGYLGYCERTTFTQRREAPTGAVTLIVDLGDGLRLADPRRPDQVVEYRTGFVAGPADHAALVDSGGRQTGVQLTMTLLGARVLLGQPLRTIANQTVDLADLLGPDGARLSARMREAHSWSKRFDLLDTLLVGRLARHAAAPAELAHAWQLLTASRGRLAVTDLAAQLGYSRNHLTRRFSAELGIAPKTLARLLRFRQVVDRLDAGGTPDLSQLAATCGYYDQSHLNRDFRWFAGITPTEHRQLTTPNFGVRAG